MPKHRSESPWVLRSLTGNDVFYFNVRDVISTLDMRVLCPDCARPVWVHLFAVEVAEQSFSELVQRLYRGNLADLPKRIVGYGLTSGVKHCALR